jgi:PAS domain S-box-containing protein
MQHELDESASAHDSEADGLISLLSAIVDSSDDAIVSKTVDGIIMSWNAAAERMFGYTAAEAIGRHITLIIPPERYSEETHVLAQISRGQKVDHFETVRVAKDGRRLDISLTVSPVKDGAGRIIGASKVARDITERKRAAREHEELLVREQAARVEAQRANLLLEEQVQALRREVLAREKVQAELAEAVNSRDQFIAVASHELRNPLNVLVLTLQLLYRASNDPASLPRVRGLVDKVKIQLERLNALVERLLDVTRIRAGKLELLPENFDLGELIREVVTRFSDQASPISIHLEPETIKGCWDQTRIDQALTNLLSNAVKYGNLQPITVAALVRNGQVVISVRDGGIGLSRDDHQRIFELFEQIPGPSGHRGLGLGLWITRRVAEAHGGTIEVESEPGMGSLFTLRLLLHQG